MSLHIPAFISNFFAHKTAAAVVAEVDPFVTALLNVLHALGFVGDHVTAVVTSAQHIAETATAETSGADKLAALTKEVVTITNLAGLEKAAAAATTVAQIGYQLAKAQNLIK